VPHLEGILMISPVYMSICQNVLYVFSMYSTLYVNYIAQQCCFLNWKKRKATYYMIQFIWHSEKGKREAKEKRSIVARSRDRGKEWGERSTRELEEGGYLGGLSPQNPQPWSHHEKNIRQTQIETFYLKTTLQNCQSQHEQGKSEKLSQIRGG
jgi:hypothetical protein